MSSLGQTWADIDTTKEVVKTLYKNPLGEPFELTNFQAVLFDSLYRKLKDRLAVLTYTQYGKSDVTAMAVLTRVTNFPERWVIIGGSEDKAKIIMNKLIDHIFDNEYTRSRLTLKNRDSVERLRHERSRNRITFNVGDGIGEVFVLSGDASRKGEDAGDILVGHGAANIIVDDAPLLSDTINAKMIRMLGGHKENFLVKIGNALNRNHFFRSYNHRRYTNILIDYEDGIAEKRQTAEFFEDAKREMNDPILFNSYYKCIFPPQDSPIAGIWTPLFTEDEIENAMVNQEDSRRKVEHFGEKKLGVDVADSGVDHDAIVMRSAGLAEILYDNQVADQMQLSGRVILEKQDKLAGRVYVDRVGVGAGLCSRLRELKFTHSGINFGERSHNPLFFNKKAELYWAARKWIAEGGKLKYDKRWLQLTNIMYSVTESTGKVQIMPKRIALSLGIKSPDIADAFVMTFYDRDVVKMDDEDIEKEFFNRRMRENKNKSSSGGYHLKMTR